MSPADSRRDRAAAALSRIGAGIVTQRWFAPGLALALALALIAPLPVSAQGDARAQADRARASIPERVRDRALRGDPVEVLVVLDDSEVEAALSAAGPALRGAARNALRQNRRDLIKQRMLARFAPGEIEVLRRFDQLPMKFLRLRSNAALEALARDPSVLEVLENLPRFAHDTQALGLIGQPAALAAGLQGANTAVVVIDSGLDYTRAEFGNCTAPGVPAGCRVVVAFDTAPDDGVRDDATLHGTRVAATVAITAPQTRLIGIDAFQGDFAYDSDIIEGINWAIANRATWNIAAINMSLGDSRRFTAACSFSNSYRVPISQALAAGIVTVISSGNSAFYDHDIDPSTPDVFGAGIASPACTPLAISVGAVYDAAIGGVGFSDCSDASTAADQPTCFSQVAPILSLLAPGGSIALLGGQSFGTSFSAPFVAGAVALLRSARPGESATQLVARLTQFGRSVFDARVGASFPRLAIAGSLQLPANDRFADALVLSGSTGQTSGSNVLATREAGEPNHAGVTGSASVWWRWTAPTTGTVTWNTVGSTFDTTLAAYTGSSVSALNPIAADNDSGGGGTSAFTFPTNAGVVYALAVDGVSGQGAITLAWSVAVIPVADIGVSLIISPPDPPLGTDATVSATVVNNGPANAQLLTLTLPIPASTALTGLSAGCVETGAAVQCTLSSLAASASASFTILLRGVVPGPTAVSVTISAATSDPAQSNNAATIPFQINAPPVPHGDVPLPGWALLLAALGVFGAALRARYRAS
ncbi:MAG: S8 family serine peptidase [Proteobacteria bacterium]|nr:S8 family serine peptidase [Burkholderiales bacterium]